MAGVPQTVTVERVGWSERVGKHLELIRDWPPNLSLAWFEHEIECERIVGLGVFADDRHVATAFYQVDDGGVVSEFVIFGFAGRLKGADLVMTVYPVLEGIARDLRCPSIRFETARRGLGRKMVKCGFQPVAMVFRKGLS